MGGQFSYCVYPDAKIKKRKTKIEKEKSVWITALDFQ